MRDVRCWPSGFAVTAVMLFAALAGGGVAVVGIVCADDAAVERVAEEPLERNGDAAEPEGGDAVVPQANARYMPVLERLLTVEIHYVRKVCNPGPEELAVIRKAGEGELPGIAKWLQAHENDGFQNATEKRPADRLTAVLLASAERVLPAEKSARYRAQLQRRREYRREAAAGMITVQTDRWLAFTKEQYPKVAETLLADWDPRWSRNLQEYLYDNYCPLPDAKKLDPVLNDRQKARWRLRGENSTIWFGWSSEVGLDQFHSGGELKELDDYSFEAKP